MPAIYYAHDLRVLVGVSRRDAALGPPARSSRLGAPYNHHAHDLVGLPVIVRTHNTRPQHGGGATTAELNSTTCTRLQGTQPVPTVQPATGVALTAHHLAGMHALPATSPTHSTGLAAA